MANTFDLSDLTAYTDQLSEKLVREAVMGSKIFKYFKVIEQPGHSVAINTFSSTLIPQVGYCVPTTSATGSVVLGQSTVTKCPITILETQCSNELREFFTQFMYKNSLNADELLPREISEIYTEDKIAKIAAFAEDLFIKGAVSGTYSASLNHCNGLFYLLDSTSITASIYSTTYSGALTPATAVTVIDDMISIMNANVQDILDAPDISLWMNFSNLSILYNALRNLNFNVNYFTKADQSSGYDDWSFKHPSFANVTIRATRGFTGFNKMVLTTDSNIVAAFSAEGDLRDFKIMYDPFRDEAVFRCRFGIGAGIVRPQYIVYKAN